MTVAANLVESWEIEGGSDMAAAAAAFSAACEGERNPIALVGSSNLACFRELEPVADIVVVGVG